MNLSDNNVVAFQSYCVKCQSTQRGKVTYVRGPGVRYAFDYLRWSCVDCGYSWETEVADRHKEQKK